MSVSGIAIPPLPWAECSGGRAQKIDNDSSERISHELQRKFCWHASFVCVFNFVETPPRGLNDAYLPPHRDFVDELDPVASF